jgi:hypothetical protein
MRCGRPVKVPSLEAAETILRMHHLCSSAVCQPRKSALAFLAEVNGPSGHSARRR